MAAHRKTLVIFGAGGDLSTRLLLPGLGQLLAADRDIELELIGASNATISTEAWQDMLRTAFAKGGADPATTEPVVARSRYLVADATSADDLRQILGECATPPALYFALPPAVTEASCRALDTIELPEGTSLALEKPFGTDLASAVALNRLVSRLVPESRVHRVDHFLGKSTVLNLLGLRFANRIFEQNWNAENVEKIEISYDEKLGLESRAGYYDKAGALVDMIQSHLLLVLALTTMEPPSTLDSDDLRGSMAQALRATHLWTGDPHLVARRARYTAGTIDGRDLPAYADEAGVNPKLNTETLAEITLTVDNWRWAGVPIVLRSGKALDDTRKDIVVTFKPVPHLPTGLTGATAPTRLHIALDPNGMKLDINVNGEGDPFTLETVSLETDLSAGQLDAYGEVLAGILTSDPSISVRGDVAEECWRIITPILEAWKNGDVPLDEYPAGSAGPSHWR
ncbi:glucose-6-phosphate 1-dehydrogenase [Glaciihabitans tibetensis]|uniref:Glucose-6-phosphate 1-dehydrogenase n=1 Tax=Glaciihabitans tibetensis TaxID=1266600 RepID=A0A2T0VCY7_9MICO|nr:glucose-6-phosphate dehydrogenase [Glaciihabitans tibetensis]PRY68039.1 glucose-6-phosphate 1-dehydrogenase [Glaciihabitans tibetensis]